MWAIMESEVCLTMILSSKKGAISLGSASHSPYFKYIFGLLIKDKTATDKYRLQGLLSQVNNTEYALKLKPDSLMLNYDKWTISPDNMLLDYKVRNDCEKSKLGLSMGIKDMNHYKEFLELGIFNNNYSN